MMDTFDLAFEFRDAPDLDAAGEALTPKTQILRRGRPAEHCTRADRSADLRSYRGGLHRPRPRAGFRFRADTRIRRLVQSVHRRKTSGPRMPPPLSLGKTAASAPTPALTPQVPSPNSAEIAELFQRLDARLERLDAGLASVRGSAAGTRGPLRLPKISGSPRRSLASWSPSKSDARTESPKPHCGRSSIFLVRLPRRSPVGRGFARGSGSGRRRAARNSAPRGMHHGAPKRLARAFPPSADRAVGKHAAQLRDDPQATIPAASPAFFRLVERAEAVCGRSAKIRWRERGIVRGNAARQIRGRRNFALRRRPRWFTGCNGCNRLWRQGPYFYQNDLYWIFLILLLTGMRTGRPPQIKLADIVRVEETLETGELLVVHFFDMRPYDPAKGRVALKTLEHLKRSDYSRVVPIHPLLIDPWDCSTEIERLPRSRQNAAVSRLDCTYEQGRRSALGKGCQPRLRLRQKIAGHQSDPRQYFFVCYPGI